MKALVEAVQNGRVEALKEQLQNGLDNGVHADDLVREGLLAGLDAVAEKFKKREAFLQEILLAARSVNTGLDILQPHLTLSEADCKGTAVCGAVKGDLHDIGIRLVEIMLMHKGFEVVDLGVNVSAEEFVEAAIRHHACLICCSAMLTVTMAEAKRVVEEAGRCGIRDEVKIMVGGTAMSQEYCDFIGADAYTEDAVACADAAEAFFF